MKEKKLRWGYTSGACMAAGAKACLFFERFGKKPELVEIVALDENRTILKIPVKRVWQEENKISAEIVKFSGDDPDITNGVSIFVSLKKLEKGAGLKFSAGKGIGTVTKKGLALNVGEPSINLKPREMVRQVFAEFFGDEKNFDYEVEVSIPDGEKLAKQTLNPILGVQGGLSIIGTTGILRPMSEEGFKNSLLPQIDVAKASGYLSQVFVPGKMGEDSALSYGLPREAIVQTSNFIGFMLEEAAKREIKKILLFGHIGKLAKVAAGVFNTHNRVGDGRLEAIASYAAAEGLPKDEVKTILQATTTEEIFPVIERNHLDYVYSILAHRASERAMRLTFHEMEIGTVMVTLKGKILGLDDNAKIIGKELGWTYE